MEVVIIGGGAAGFFSAISAKTHYPSANITIVEKTDKLLAKVRVSGGGRCNVTHHCFNVGDLMKHYPRGGRRLRKAFGIFSPSDTVSWFKARGVELKTEQDGRMFPVTDSSQTIIDCLLAQAKKLGVSIKTQSTVKSIYTQNGLVLRFKNGETKPADKVIIATGGSPRPEGLNWLKELGHKIETPVPSLFTFNMPDEPIKELMGVSAQHVGIKVMGTKLKSEGPLLITHWGMSGPAVLKLSAFGARALSEQGYVFNILVNWTGDRNEQEIRSTISNSIIQHGKKRVYNSNPFELPGRLWQFLIDKLSVGQDMIWQNLGKKNVNRMVHLLMTDKYQVRGKTTFKEEFVTCGGVSLSDVDFKTMQSKIIPGLYFAGEVLDIDGVTGGFNFQAAWTTGFIAGNLA